MRVLIIDQCSATKEVPNWFEPFSAEAIDANTLEQLIDQSEIPSYRARDLYQGRQQIHLSNATDRLRASDDDVDRYFISAGFGLVDESEILPPYDVTFTDMTDREIDDRGQMLRIQEDFLDTIKEEQDYDVVFLPLGRDYYRVLDLDAIIDKLPVSTVVVLFNQREVADRYENVISVSARNGEAKEQGEIVVGLKGKYILNFAKHRAEGHQAEGQADIIEFLTTDPTDQVDFEEFGV